MLAIGTRTRRWSAVAFERVIAELSAAERAHIIGVLDRCDWAIEGRGKAAERLGLRPSTVRNRMRKLGIRRLTEG